MNKEKGYFECIFIDGIKEDFDKKCTSVEDFGSNKDMIIFKARNDKTKKCVTLQIIPKLQIKQIINHYTESDIREVFE